MIMILPYFVVDYGSTRVATEVVPGEPVHIDKFDISILLTKQFEGLDDPYPIYHLLVTDNQGTQYQLEILQGVYKGQYWNKGAWLTQSTRDIYILLLDDNTGYFVDPAAPVQLQISEKPYANLFRISLFFQVALVAMIVAVAIRPLPQQEKILREVKPITT